MSHSDLIVVRALLNLSLEEAAEHFGQTTPDIWHQWEVTQSAVPKRVVQQVKMSIHRFEKLVSAMEYLLVCDEDEGDTNLSHYSTFDAYLSDHPNASFIDWRISQSVVHHLLSSVSNREDGYDMTNDNNVPQGDYLSNPSNIPAMDRQTFEYVLRCAMGAADMSIPVENPSLQSVQIIYDEGDEQTVTFTDNPFNRAMFASKEQFSQDSDKFINFSLRMMALIGLFDCDGLKDYIKLNPDDDSKSILHPAVIYAAAEAPLNDEGDFDKDMFLTFVKSIEIEIRH